MRDFVGPVRIWWGAGRSLYLGPGYHAASHRCESNKLCIALDGVLRWTAEREQGEGTCCWVPGGCAHELECADSRVAIAWFDSRCTRNASTPEWSGIAAQTVTAEQREQLLRLLTSGETNADVLGRLERLASLLTPPPTADPKMEEVLAIVHARGDERLSLQSLAREVGVSRSWLSHAFSRAAGVPLRRFLLWRRLRRACELGLSGWSLSRAAPSAGFADGAHFSRAYRAAFGIAPIRLFELRDRIDLRAWS